MREYGNQYLFRNTQGVFRETGLELAKILSARENGVRLHSYDVRERKFYCCIGADLPDLYRRALVSQSGELPIEQDGLKVYGHVSKELADITLAKLYLISD